MKSSIRLCLFAIMLFSSQLIFAHGEGHALINEETAIIAASNNIATIIAQGIEIEGNKLNESWENIPGSDKAIHKKGNGYYIVSLENKVKGKTLYVLLSNQGELYDANYSGVFEGLK